MRIEIPPKVGFIDNDHEVFWVGIKAVPFKYAGGLSHPHT